ncbi:MAG: MTH1187 family thiamine-binding protein [Magnetococcales bacterium]|nr:MTH1187 family thiamine-binding protein [Magnetococcales bacterium]
MSVLLEFSMTPLDKGESVSTYVARSLDIIDGSGLPYQLGPMGTSVEGEWDEVMAVVKKCYERMNADCNRITLSLKADIRKNAQNRLTEKIASVEKKLGRSINHSNR